MIFNYLIKSKAGDIQYLWDRYIDPAFNNLNLEDNRKSKGRRCNPSYEKSWGCYILAHFHKKIGFKNYTREEQEANIKYLHEIGLDGMETYYQIIVKMMKICHLFD